MSSTSPVTRTRVVLTRRGKITLRIGLFLLVVVTIAGYLALSPAVGAASDQFAPKTTVVVIQQGQTLWSLAIEAQPERDPRDVVSDIYELNNLESGSQIYVGQVLHIPVSN